MKGSKIKVFTLLIAVSMFFSLATSSAACYADSERPDKLRASFDNRPAYREGEFLIKFKDGTSSYRMSSFASKSGLIHKESFDSMSVGLYTAKGSKSLNNAINAMEDNDDIEYVQPNYLYYPVEILSGEYSSLWGFDDIDAPEAWDITTGEADIIVAVIDTGVDINHPELEDRIWANTGEIADNGLDDDNQHLIHLRN